MQRRISSAGGNQWFVRSAHFVGGFLFCLAVSNLTSLGQYLPFGTGPSSGRKMKSAVLFGDSITQEASDPTRMGWVSSLSAYWIRRIDVSNRGFGGYNSRWGLRIFEEAVMQQRPDIVVIFFGANDAVDERVPQSVPLEEYTSNLRTMVITLQRRLPHTVVMLMTPPPVYEPVLEENNRIKGKALLSDRTCQRTEKYAAAVLHLGEELGVSVVDNFYSMDPTKPSREEYLRDGLHLSAKGNQRVYTNLVHTVERDHPALKPDPDAPAGDGMVWPHWSKIVANPAII